MKNLLIIGARGFGREVFHISKACVGFNTDFRIKGYLDDKIDALDIFPGYPPIIDSVESYKIQEDDVFICALGEVKMRKKYAQMIIDKGGNFMSIIHPNTKLTKNTIIGRGCILASDTIISCNVTIGDFVSIQSLSVIGHDVRIGSCCQLNSFCFIGGFVTIAEEVTIHPGAIIHPQKKLGKGSIIGAGAFVVRNVAENTTVFGNPAKKLR
jgi:sugar O-acyltransferase (sialic acid O-acetyltransferase NeuD family)